jgi:hypothetical protein
VERAQLAAVLPEARGQRGRAPGLVKDPGDAAARERVARGAAGERGDGQGRAPMRRAGALGGTRARGGDAVGRLQRQRAAEVQCRLGEQPGRLVAEHRVLWHICMWHAHGYKSWQELSVGAAYAPAE